MSSQTDTQLFRRSSRKRTSTKRHSEDDYINEQSSPINNHPKRRRLDAPDGEEEVYYPFLSIWTDERCLLHRVPDDEETQDEFAEKPARLSALWDMIRERGWEKKAGIMHWSLPERVPPTRRFDGLHDSVYLDKMEKRCKKVGEDDYAEDPALQYYCKDSFLAAKVSADLVVQATRHVIRTPLEDRAVAVVLNRPPGHHVGGSHAAGYCFINNTGLAIERNIVGGKKTRSRAHETKAVIVDVDVHHGNGTQDMFLDDPNVLHISIHKWDGRFYPATGAKNELGIGEEHEAWGKTVNIPLQEGATDHDLIYVTQHIVWPLVREFDAFCGFFSLGTDGVQDDASEAGMRYTPMIFGRLAYEFFEIVDKLVVTTEGGYTPENLKDGFHNCLVGLTSREPVYEGFEERMVMRRTKNVVKTLKKELKMDEFED